MRIAIAYNGRGAWLAQTLKLYLSKLGHEVFEFGVTESDQDDADIAYYACKQISNEHIDQTIMLCGAGQCSCIVANKMNGLYAASCNDMFEAHQARLRYNTNVLCLPVRWLDAKTAEEIVKEWLKTPFQHSRRNERALEKIRAIEKGQCPMEHVFSQKVSDELS